MEEKILSLENTIKVITHTINILNAVNLGGVENQNLNIAAHGYMNKILEGVQGEFNALLNEKKKKEIEETKKNEIKENI